VKELINKKTYRMDCEKTTGEHQNSLYVERVQSDQKRVMQADQRPRSPKSMRWDYLIACALFQTENAAF
jgi:hypothetical protein